MTREEFEKALQVVYDDDGYHEETDVQRVAILAHDAEQREEIARLRAMRDYFAGWAVELNLAPGPEFSARAEEWFAAKAKEAKP